MLRIGQADVRYALLLLVACVLCGCERGPARDSLRQALQERLDSRFEQDLFAVREFRRTGSAPFRDLALDISGVYVYYDAELEFRQDYSLSRWLGLNLGTLAYAIGATEAGIDGFRAQGNQSGDVLRVYGRFAYRSDGKGGWESLDGKFTHGLAGEAQPAAGGPGPSPENVLRDARSLLDSGREYASDSRAALVVEELDYAITRIDLRTAILEHKITLGSGTAPGTYYAFGEALSHYAGQRGVPLFSAASEGSLDNASRLQAARLDFGLVQSDVAQLLYRGLRSAGIYPYNELRAVASLWPEAVHLLTFEGSGITRLADLKGRRVAIGSLGSGSRVNALLIGLAAQLNGEPLPAIREISLARGIAQLESGEVDALFLTEAVPAPAVQKLASHRKDLRFLPIPPELIPKLAEKHFAYYPLTVPARTYPGQAEPFATLGLAAALITHSQVEDKKVEQMLELLLDGGDELARNFYRAAFIGRETMQLGLSVPLHPAAERFYARHDRQHTTGTK